MKNNIEDILKLPENERVEILELILDSLHQDNTSNNIPDWHMEILKDRMAKYEGNLSEGKSWKEVKRSLLIR